MLVEKNAVFSTFTYFLKLEISKILRIKDLFLWKYTGLLSKDETAETSMQYLFGLFLYHC